ncbi:cation:proton antiporter [Nesterenkonia sp.]|uniref:cation:proton antiporter domain-containing protein n=1 Tax=Nesterenkonia sp. TaxID=704201 RepID=UPI00262D59E2|nr:cation:proton antiporter [Nesterenkonia sp.]
MEDFGVPTSTLLEQGARLTLAVGLTGVALRLPHGYWKRNLRWLLVIIGIGMAAMLAVGTGALWAGLTVPFVMALMIGAIITPTHPVVTTPIVTGSLAEEKVPERVRYNLSVESGINDGLAYLFVMLPILLMTSPPQLHWWAPIIVIAAILGRRLVTIWTLRPLFRTLHNRPQTFFLSWFAPIGVSALFYATLAEKHTGNPEIFTYASLAITASVLIHGLSAAPISAWLKRHQSQSSDEAEAPSRTA